MSSAVTTCPICKSDCDITEEDLIDADCGACGIFIVSSSFSIFFFLQSCGVLSIFICSGFPIRTYFFCSKENAVFFVARGTLFIIIFISRYIICDVALSISMAVASRA